VNIEVVLTVCGGRSISSGDSKHSRFSCPGLRNFISASLASIEHTTRLCVGSGDPLPDPVKFW
jgi:hypothetical protein